MMATAWKVSKYGIVSGPYFPIFGLNTGKYRPEITRYFDTFHTVATSHTNMIEQMSEASCLRLKQPTSFI